MVTSLTEALGVPATLENDGSLSFGCTVEEVLLRKTNDFAALGVLSSTANWLPDSIVAFIYRYLDDEAVLLSQPMEQASELGVKLDVTVVLAGSDVSTSSQYEYPKTIGHYHTAANASGVPSPDLYQVVYGTGVVVLQPKSDNLVESIVVPVKAGTTLLIPPHLGHASVNTGTDPLVFANICVRRPHLNYEDIHRKAGMATYFHHPYRVESNPRYIRSSPPRQAKPNVERLEELGILAGATLRELTCKVEVLDLLCRPERHIKSFEHALDFSN
jgi:glucose-6-phosphate isomerase, archaeal